MLFLQVYSNRALFGIADGCGWGPAAAEAAHKTMKTFLEFVGENHFSITSSRTAAQMFLNMFYLSHQAIIEGKAWFLLSVPVPRTPEVLSILQTTLFEAGTTTCLVGMIFQHLDEKY